MTLDQLQKIAEEADQIKWTASEPNGRGHGWKAGPAWLGESAWSPKCAANAAHIAAFDPPTVLRLIAVARAAQPGLVALEASMKKMDEFSYRLVMAGRDPDRPLEAISALRSAIAELDAQQEPT